MTSMNFIRGLGISTETVGEEKIHLRQKKIETRIHKEEEI